MRHRISNGWMSAKLQARATGVRHFEPARWRFRWSGLIGFLGIVGILTHCEIAHGLAEERIGPDSDRQHPTTAQPGSFKGIVGPLKHPSRVYSRWVNGNENFYFKATPDEINELLDLFSKVRMRDHEVWIKPGTETVKSSADNVFDYNVSLQIISGIALALHPDKDTAETFEPRLTVYVGDDPALLKQLKLPDNAIVHCEIERAEIKGKATKPSRKNWYGCVQFDDSTPAVDMEHGLSTQVTLWDNAFGDGIPLTDVDRDGTFKAVFSEEELADLKRGKTWLTMTVGNRLTQPKKSDPRFPAALLALEREKAAPHKICRPQYYYYGRVLFEDGSPAILDPTPWPGAEIGVSVPYAGLAALDAEGYFKVVLQPDQFANLKARKPGKNIYCPTVDHNRSRATDAFPPELLSQDKAKAGVVRIAKPIFKPQYDLAKAPSLVGKPLPALTNFRIAPGPGDFDRQMVLLYFFDFQQRPSRHWMTQLLKQAEELKKGGVLVIAVQTSTVDRDVLESYVATNRVAFALGIIGTDEEKTRFDWGVKSQPWMILTDRHHIVRAEGFRLAELNGKLEAITMKTAAERL